VDAKDPNRRNGQDLKNFGSVMQRRGDRGEETEGNGEAGKMGKVRMKVRTGERERKGLRMRFLEDEV